MFKHEHALFLLRPEDIQIINLYEEIYNKLVPFSKKTLHLHFNVTKIPFRPMKFLFQHKTRFLIVLFLVFCQFSINSQNTVAKDYLNATGDYAAVYNGKIEPVYAVNIYKNLPYYENAYFVSGEMIYRDKFYPDQQLKLDLYKEQVITLSPQHYGVVLESKDVKEVSLHGKTFIWYIPVQSKDLKQGFYMRLHEGKNMMLLCKISLSMNKELIKSSFSSKTRFYFVHNGNHYTVKNKNSFIKIFPKYKNQINQFVKEQKLKFGPESERSLALLAQYCENLHLGNL